MYMDRVVSSVCYLQKIHTFLQLHLPLSLLCLLANAPPHLVYSRIE